MELICHGIPKLTLSKEGLLSQFLSTYYFKVMLLQTNDYTIFRHNANHCAATP